MPVNAQNTSGDDPMPTWTELQSICHECQNCQLASTRHNVVFGDGNPQSPVLFVGEGPGEQEDLTGIPFVGAAGQLLDQMLAIIDLNRSNYYITNIVKCRPPRNRDPRAEEQDACIGYLRTQVKMIRPKLIICLGRIAAQRLIDPNYRITKEHGQWVQKGTFWMTAIYHPSALLRDLSKRPETFDDLISIREKINSVCPEVYQGLS
jgi:DNA polymerase